MIEWDDNISVSYHALGLKMNALANFDVVKIKLQRREAGCGLASIIGPPNEFDGLFLLLEMPDAHLKEAS